MPGPTKGLFVIDSRMVVARSGGGRAIVDAGLSEFTGEAVVIFRYRASKFDCDVCVLKMQCCPNMPARQVPRDIHEDARDAARRLIRTKAFPKSRDERKRVEMRFAHLKVHHGFERMRLRGLSGARDEFHLAAIVQNLKTLALRAFRPPNMLCPASVA
jgi:Transposase DDE domain